LDRNNAFGAGLSTQFPSARVGIENTKNNFLTEKKEIFYAKSQFPDFSPISGYRDVQNIQLDRNNAFGARLFTQFLLAGVSSENIKNEFLMEQKGIVYAESMFLDFSPLSSYRDLQNIKSVQNNAFRACFCTQFLPLGVWSEITEIEFLMEQ